MTAVESDVVVRTSAGWLKGGPTVGDLGERGLIQRIHARVPPPPDWLPVGIGDDAAVLEPARGALDVVTTDALLEGVHFDPAVASPGDVGYKALAVNLSDLAAMGATPRAAVLSLAVAERVPVAAMDALVEGFLECAARYRTALVGGNISRSPGPLVVSVTAMGSARPRKVLTRSGAHAGDELFVSGSIGAAAAALTAFRAADAPNARGIAARCGPRLLRPEPRLALGARLGRTRAASACIDLSDGLADGVRQLADASGIGAVIEAEALPIDADARRWCESLGLDAVVAAISGGEDYELLFTVPRKHRRRLEAALRGVGLPVTRIGTMTKELDMRLRRGTVEEVLPPGFTHF